jgi:hypothetical protein
MADSRSEATVMVCVMTLRFLLLVRPAFDARFSLSNMLIEKRLRYILALKNALDVDLAIKTTL